MEEISRVHFSVFEIPPNTLYLNSYQRCVTVATWSGDFSRQHEELGFKSFAKWRDWQRVGKQTCDLQFLNLSKYGLVFLCFLAPGSFSSGDMGIYILK